MHLRRRGKSYVRALRAENKSEATVDCYGQAIEGLVRYLEAEGSSAEVEPVRLDGVRGFIAKLFATRRPNTALNHYRALKTFFRWAVTEEEINASPMEKKVEARRPSKHYISQVSTTSRL